MSAENSAIYSDGVTEEVLRTRLRDLTRDTKKDHHVWDMNYPAWGLGFLGMQPIPESKNVIARATMTVPPGESPKNGDVIVIPLRNGASAIGMIFDPKPTPGDYIGDAYSVHIVQYSPQGAIGHEFVEKGKGAAR